MTRVKIAVLLVCKERVQVRTKKGMAAFKLVWLFLWAGFFFLFLPPAHAEPDQIVMMQTTKGPIVLRIFVSAVPATAGNFLDLVQRGFYNGLSFHRIETWCIQGGDPNGNGTGSFIDPSTGQARYLRLEINGNFRHNAPGILAMARSNNPNSASCQFYITKRAMPQLDGQYAIFGTVINGMPAVYNMQRGDRILSAEIVHPKQQAPAPSASSSSSSSSPTGDSGF
jgi:cyclophilin family peptidyl-prolyl cis-trans isomerase